MKTHEWSETFEDRRVTYTQELEGRFVDRSGESGGDGQPAYASAHQS
jgi:hypothetical protein